jgi:hypothetical protein
MTDRWRCRLSVSPKRVSAGVPGTPGVPGDQVTLTVTLSYGNYDLQPQEYSLFQSPFSPTFNSRVPQLNTYFLQTPPVQSHSAPNQFIISQFPSVPDGPCTISVTATPASPGGTIQLGGGPGGARRNVILPQNPLGGPDSISVITHVIETQSSVTLQRTFAGPTDDRALWPAIRNRTAAIGFDRYQRFIDCIFCHPDRDIDALAGIGASCLDPVNNQDPTDRRHLSIYGPQAYNILKLATQVFLTLESGVVLREGRSDLPKIFDIQKEQIRLNDFTFDIDELKTELERYLGGDRHLPYLDRIVRNLITIDPGDPREVLPYCLGVLQHRLTSPSLMELIWSYWLEEGMLIQTMNAIARRFQNRRGSPNDPLGELEFDTLRPLSNLIWGFIQDEHNRLTVPRRAHEYQHHYGLSLEGKAVSDVYPADSRSKFIEGYHNLLSAAARFFREDSDTTVIADAFPLLNALKEVHLLLAEGAHNQFGDLTWTARAEMLTIQWMLARPEMKEFLRGRYSVPYQEDWMGAVDSMKKLQGWTDTTITHFYELAVEGERILLTVRYGDWSDIENIEDQAKNWARSNKPEIQRYIHAYRTVTGVDLSAEMTDTRDAATRYMQPSMLLRRRLMEQMSAMPLRAPRRPDLVAARVSARAQLAAPARPKLPAYRKES